MEFSPQQKQAHDQVKTWLADPQDQIFRLFGYAGTGKTTIAKVLTDEVEGGVYFMTFTGKAALVLRDKGCPGATTIHSMIYTPKIKSMSHLAALQRQKRELTDPGILADIEYKIGKEKENLRHPAFNLNLQSPIADAKLIVLDEVSMVGNQIGSDLVTFGVPILALGDPAQLPPVGDGGYFTNQEPDALLTEIHRQAEGSPIIHLATEVRNGRMLKQGTYGESMVIAKGVHKIADMVKYDQIIVGKNETRRVINNEVRKYKGINQHLPMTGEMLICLKNDKETGLLNGSQWEVQSCEVVDEDMLCMNIRAPGNSEDNYAFEVMAWRHYFEGREKDIAPYSMMEAQHFDFGYAITCHKSQGSQYGSVVVVDESQCFRQDARKWLYTAITRAADRITVIQ